jgi:heme exporter protein CcmD
MSLAELINMGGHGGYVWSCYFMTFAVIGLLIRNARKQRKLLLIELTAQLKSES